MSEHLPKGAIIVKLGPRDGAQRFAMVYEMLDDKGMCVAKIGYVAETAGDEPVAKRKRQSKPPTNS